MIKYVYFSDYRWDFKSAQVACKMMGFKSEYAEATIGSKFGFETDKYTMLSVACKGTEDTLEDCRYQPAGVCNGNGKAGVICHGTYLFYFALPTMSKFYFR